MAEIPDALTQLKAATTFYCRECKKSFSAEPARTEPLPDSPHPFEYFASCPVCNAECTEAHWHKNLYLAWLNISGTGNPAASAKNLPSAGDSRAKFNALKSGLFAKKAQYFPAAVGRYPECEGCATSADCEDGGICIEISKIKMIVQRAVDTSDPSAITALTGQIQADVFVMIQRLMSQALRDGVTLTKPLFTSHENRHSFVKYPDEDGNVHQVYETTVHPAVRAVAELLQKNNLALGDMLLTQKTAGEQNLGMGFLKNDETRTQTAAEAAVARKAATDEFIRNLQTAPVSRAADSAFQDHEGEGGEK